MGADDGRYDLWAYGPNGFVREFKGAGSTGGRLEVVARYDVPVSSDGFERRFAGRLETGEDGISDPLAMITG